MLRGVRVLLLAAAVVGLSVVAHGLAGGTDPGAVPLGVLAVLTAVAVRPLTRREVGLPRLLGLLGAGQLVLHVVFDRCAALSPADAAAHAHSSSPLAMLGAHAVATLAVALVLRYGDAVLWRLWTWLVGRRVPGRPRRLVVPAAPPPSARCRRCATCSRAAPRPGEGRPSRPDRSRTPPRTTSPDDVHGVPLPRARATAPRRWPAPPTRGVARRRARRSAAVLLPQLSPKGTTMRKTLRAVGAAALTTGLVVTGAAAASAHVTVTPDTTEAGSYALLTFGVPHGCGDSPTTKVSVQVPEQVVTVTPR